MLKTDGNRRAARDRVRGGGRQRRRYAQSGHRGAANATRERQGSDADGSESTSSPPEKQQRIRIRRDDLPPDNERDAVGPEEAVTDRSTRRALDSAARSDGDPDSKLQLTLELSEPEPRGYEASAEPPKERIDTTRWLWLAMGVGAVTCPILLGFQLVFTNPAHGLNVLSVVITMSFGVLFASWTFEYWLRRGTAAKPARPSSLALTRHSILASVGVAAMAVSALNRTASFGLLILVIFTLVVADLVLSRLRIR